MRWENEKEEKVQLLDTWIENMSDEIRFAKTLFTKSLRNLYQKKNLLKWLKRNCKNVKTLGFKETLKTF